MVSKVYLATYHIKITNRKLNEQILSRFNGSTDLFDVLVSFFEDLYVNKRQEKNSEEKNTTIHFTLRQRPTYDKSKRIIYGFIDSGLSGDSSVIKEIESNEEVFEVDPEAHGAFKELFFYCQVPQNSKRGFLILQKKASHGVKIATERLIKRWIRQKGYMDSYFWLNNVINGEVFNHMIEKGNLKKIELVYNWAPATLDDLIGNPDGGIETTKGKMKTVVIASTSLGQDWKDIAKGVFSKPTRSTVIETANGAREFDEIEFELEFGGKKKKFYAKNRNRTLPDIDVTDSIEFLNRKPLLSSLLKKSEELIIDVFNYKGDV